MAGPVPLGCKIAFIVRIGRQLVGHALDNRDPRLFQARYLFGIVGQQADAVLTQQLKHARRNPEVARIDSKTEAEIGIDGIKALILQLISPQLVDEADPTTFLPQIEQDAPPMCRY